MKFKQYLTEWSEYASKLPEVLKKDCIPYLKSTSGKHPIVFYRGSKTSTTDYFKVKTRKNRIPKDTPLEIHNKINKLFKKKFGWFPRSEGVFASSGMDQAGIYSPYGNISIIFPIGKFTFLYNNNVYDLTDELENTFNILTTDYGKKGQKEWSVRKGINDDTIDTTLQMIVNTYTNKNLHYISDNTEIVFKCKEYYMVSLQLFEHYKKEIYDI